MNVQLSSLKGCKLSIGKYPTFSYNARGGGGVGVMSKTNKRGVKNISFKIKDSFQISWSYFPLSILWDSHCNLDH